jgi:hypothetical protein
MAARRITEAHAADADGRDVKTCVTKFPVSLFQSKDEPE